MLPLQHVALRMRQPGLPHEGLGCAVHLPSVSLPDGDSLQGNNAHGRGYSVGFRESEPGSDPSVASFQLCDFPQVT